MNIGQMSNCLSINGIDHLSNKNAIKLHSDSYSDEYKYPRAKFLPCILCNVLLEPIFVAIFANTAYHRNCYMNHWISYLLLCCCCLHFYEQTAVDFSKL